jgi:hypothetical protein
VRFDSAISSFESQPTKFVPSRSQGKSTPIPQAVTLAKSPRSQSKPIPHTIPASHQTLANLLRSQSTPSAVRVEWKKFRIGKFRIEKSGLRRKSMNEKKTIS